MIGPFFPSRSGRFGEGLWGLSMLMVRQRGHLIESDPASAFSSILNSRRLHCPQRCSFLMLWNHFSLGPLVDEHGAAIS